MLKSNAESCKHNSNGTCKVSQCKISHSHCNSCESYEEKIKCSSCEDYIDEGKEFYHKWDIGQVENPICESCRDNETV